MRTVWMTLLCSLVFTATLAAKRPPHVKEEKPGLLAKARVSSESALATAQARFPKATLTSAEIEEEEGSLIYSFDFKTKGRSGIDEVNVNAINGEIVNIEHETPNDEAKERAKDPKATR